MPGNFPLVTIGIPVYNGGAYIRETLDSIQEQEYICIELLIVDDASTDDSYTLCKEWIGQCRFPVWLYRNELNKGLPATCNIILQKSNGKYLQLLGQDDILKPTKIKDDVALMEQSPDDVAVIYSQVQLINENGELTGQNYFDRIGYDGQLKVPVFLELIKKNFIPAPTAIMRTELVRATGGYDETLLFEDWDMWLRLSRDYKVVFHDVCNVLYRIHGDSMMANRSVEQDILRNDANIRMIKKQLGLNKAFENELLQKLKELSIYSFFIGDKTASNKLHSFLQLKKDFKIFLYYTLAKAGLTHPSKLLRFN